MHIYNTLTKKIEKFIPYDPNMVTMYTCGPTVYYYAHIGNLRTYIFEDVLEKTLAYNRYPVKRVMNITDVGHMTSDGDTGEDKMSKGAIREQKTVQELAAFYTEAFFSDLEKLNIAKPEIVEKASDHIEEYIIVIDKLVKDDIAYVSEGNVYFDVEQANEYYKLSGKNSEDLIVGAREDVGEDFAKRNPGDFGLWFTNSKFKNQILQWDSPWGRGYPGWHIECSGLALKYLGEHLDIHCGGVDNVFPHHTNEIAQSEAYLGHKWCNYWLHGEHLNDDTGKMSKSKGEVLTLSVLIDKGYNPLVYRFFCLQSHYRKQLVFAWESIEMASSAYQKLLNKVKSIKEQADDGIDADSFNKYQELFKKALNDDLNTANAFTILYDVLKDEQLSNQTKLKLVKSFDKVLSLDLLKEDAIEEELLLYIDQKIKERDEAKANKDYQKADAIREELKEKGILIKDTKDKTIFETIK